MKTMSDPSVKLSCDTTLTSTAPAETSCASAVDSSTMVFVVVALVVIKVRVVAAWLIEERVVLVGLVCV